MHIFCVTAKYYYKIILQAEKFQAPFTPFAVFLSYKTGTSGDRNVLQEVRSTLVDQRTCYYKWGYKIDSTKVCFGNGYKGACMVSY